MAKLWQAGVLTAAMAALFIVLEVTVHLKTGMAGVFVAGVSGGLFLARHHMAAERR